MSPEGINVKMTQRSFLHEIKLPITKDVSGVSAKEKSFFFYIRRNISFTTDVWTFLFCVLTSKLVYTQISTENRMLGPFVPFT